MTKERALAEKHLLLDPHLAKIIQSTQIPPNQASGEIYYDLLRAIVHQQLSGRAAATIHHRFLELYDARYPDPEEVLATSLLDLRSVGLSGQKSLYVQAAAQHFLQKNLLEVDWSNYADEEIIMELTQIKGVGVWTVQMLLIFSLGRPDVFPVDDLAIRKAMVRLFSLTEEKAALKNKMIELAETWRPHRTLASQYLWAWYSS